MFCMTLISNVTLFDMELEIRESGKVCFKDKIYFQKGRMFDQCVTFVHVLGY